MILTRGCLKRFRTSRTKINKIKDTFPEDRLNEEAKNKLEQKLKMEKIVKEKIQFLKQYETIRPFAKNCFC